MDKIYARLLRRSRKLIVLTALFCTGGQAIYAQGTKLRVLFIGNSFTSNNNLPLLTDQIARSMGDTLIYDSNTPGEFTFEAHIGDAASVSRIGKGDWNYVVLQEQSQRPALPDADVSVQVFPYAQMLDSLVREKNKCGRSVFYMTWGYPDGDPANCPAFPDICTYEGMDSMLNKRYSEMALMNEALLAPVGMVFRELMKTSPGINLFAPDRMHPSEAGSYAAALTFYTLLYRRDPVMVPFDYTLTAPEAMEVKRAVSTVVFTELPKWHVGQYDPKVGFTYSKAGGVVNFSSDPSMNLVNYSWNFGDGHTSTEANPEHTYTSSGTFNVTLYGDNCILLDSAKATVDILLVSVPESSLEQSLKVFPNPAGSLLSLGAGSGNASLKDASIRIHDLIGTLVYETSGYSGPLQIGHLAPGLYQLSVRDRSGNTVTRKFTKL